MSIESFVSTLRSDGVPSEVSSTVYSYYESFMLMRRLILSPADRRYDLFGSTDEDLLDDARLILRRLRIASTEEELARFATTRPDLLDLRQPQRVTLGDVARFVTAARERLGK